jgi:broad specificity phosphatase PhoE
MPHLYVVRHAEPAITGVLLGQSDPPLSESGRRHAAELLRGTRLEIVYTSPLRRARETAELIARGAPIAVVGDLREITYGDWDGRTWAEIHAKHPELARRKLEDWRGVTPPGGELWDEFEARVRRAFERIKCGPQPAALVAHAAVNRVLTGVDLGYGEAHEL